MELVYDIVALVFVLALGYITEEHMRYYVFLSMVLVPAGIVMGYLLEPTFIYGILFLLGLVLERMYFTYKWQMTKRPKSADYKKGHDWAMKLISTLIIIISIDTVSDINLLYTFMAFLSGILVSWAIKFLFENGGFRFLKNL